MKTTHPFSGLPVAVLLTACAIVFAHPMMAQRDTVLTQSAEFEGERKLFLRDANKLPNDAVIREQVSQMTTIKYSTLPTRKIATIEPQLIQAARVNVDEKLAKLYRGYIKAGYGSYFTPLVDAYYTDGRSRRGEWGLHYQHLSSAGGVTPNDEDTIDDHFSENRAELWGKHFFRKAVLNGNLNWERNMAHWYGFNNALFDASDARLAMDSLRQRVNTFGGKVGYATFNRDSSDYNYSIDLSVRGTADLYDGKETNVDFVAKLSRLINTELFSGELGVNYNSFGYFGPDLGPQGNILMDEGQFRNRRWDNSVIRLIPMAQTVWRDLRAKVGMGLYIEGRADNPGHFYPLAEVSYNLFDGIVVPFAGVRGSTEPTTYLSLYNENPFVMTFPDLKNRNNKLELYGGIGGAISRTVSYNVGVNHFTWANFAYFVNDSIASVGNRFAVVYDDLKALNVHGELAVYSGEKWKANIRGDYFHYTPGREARPWHQPELKIMASGQYNMSNKLIVGMDLFYLGTRWAKSNVAVEGIDPQEDGTYHVELKGFLDANLKVEYRYNKRLSGWVQMHNALASRYQRWNAFNNQRFLGLMGATYAF
ncbi:MAG: hypothetical protein ACK500_12315 [Flavobacteriales bacterium]|jgi:hypothetical protein